MCQNQCTEDKLLIEWLMKFPVVVRHPLVIMNNVGFDRFLVMVAYSVILHILGLIIASSENSMLYMMSSLLTSVYSKGDNTSFLYEDSCFEFLSNSPLYIDIE